MRRGRGGAQQVDPEEIFNMFFGGGMNQGFRNGGFHVYTTGFGPGMQFRAARPRQNPQRGQQQAEAAPGFGLLLQFLPIILIAALSFLKFDGNEGGSMPGEGKYFSLTVRTVG